MFFIQKKRSVTPIGHSQYLTGKVATCSGLPHLPAAVADPEAAAAESVTNTVEQTVVEEDGTVVKVITKTTTDTNGNQTVTETQQVIQPAGSSPVVATATLQDVDIPVTSVQAITD